MLHRKMFYNVITSYISDQYNYIYYCSLLSFLRPGTICLCISRGWLPFLVMLNWSWDAVPKIQLHPVLDINLTREERGSIKIIIVVTTHFVYYVTGTMLSAFYSLSLHRQPGLGLNIMPIIHFTDENIGSQTKDLIFSTSHS